MSSGIATAQVIQPASTRPAAHRSHRCFICSTPASGPSTIDDKGETLSRGPAISLPNFRSAQKGADHKSNRHSGDQSFRDGALEHWNTVSEGELHDPDAGPGRTIPSPGA